MNDYLCTKVFTNHGIKDIKDVIPFFDTVYDYITGKEINVQRVVPLNLGNYYCGIYTDGRASFYHECDAIYEGNGKIIPISTFNRSICIRFRNPLEHNPIPFDNVIRSPLPIDPYVLGILYTYGDFTDEYVNIGNIPLRVISDILLNRDWGFTSASWSTDNSKYYLHKDGNNKKIEWNTFFNPLLFLSIENDVFWRHDQERYNIIPDDYKYGSLLDRMKFIRGVIDMSYDKDLSPDNITITSNDLTKIQEIQKVLWSLVILKKSHVIHMEHELVIYNFHLSIVDGLKRYPGLFHRLDNIEYMLDIDNKILDHDTPFELKIKFLKFNPGMVWTCRLELEKPNAIYLSGNFLPRVGM